MLLLENEEKKEKQRKLKKLAAYNKQVISELRNEELKLDETKKKEKSYLIKNKIECIFLRYIKLLNYYIINILI